MDYFSETVALLRKLVGIAREYTAETLGAIVALGQLLFLRSVPLLWIVALWLPAALIAYGALKLAVPVVKRRFRSPHNHAPELMLSTFALGVLFWMLDLPWWSAVFLGIILAMMVFSLAEKNTGVFHTIYTALLVFLLFAGAHRLVLLEFRLVTWLLDRREQPAGELRAVRKENRLVILRGETPSLEASIVSDLQMEPTQDLRWIPGLPLAQLAGKEGLPMFVPFEMTRRETGETIAVLLGGMNLSGGAEGLAPPRVDRLSFAGVEMPGLLFTFTNARTGRAMQLGIYCASRFDTSFLILEESQPGFPHAPPILSQLDQIRPGSQTGNRFCAFDNP